MRIFPDSLLYLNLVLQRNREEKSERLEKGTRIYGREKEGKGRAKGAG